MTTRGNERFTPRRRRAPIGRTGFDEENLQRELERILDRCVSVAGSNRADFSEGRESYDVASMAIIRFASLLERPESAQRARLLSADELAALRMTRNIAAHAGYDGMNDDLFWTAVTQRVPELVRRILVSMDS